MAIEIETPNTMRVQKIIDGKEFKSHHIVVPAAEKESLPESYVPTKNITTGRVQCPFRLPTTFGTGCENNVCHASAMDKYGSPLGGLERPSQEIWSEAHEYLREFYRENKLSDLARDARLEEVKSQIYSQGYYIHTYDELSFGVKTAWRNSRRCVMRSQWNTIQTIDKRHVNDSKAMLEACFDHMRTASNGGRIRPTMTVFPQKFPGRYGPRVWNPQVVRYAGYEIPDGTIIGDPANVEITKVAISLGWEPKYGRWDVLPLIVCADGQEPVWGEVPRDSFIEVKVTHPNYDWFAELDLRWHDHPPVSLFALTLGGIDYCAIPFSGWYLGTEVASRNLGDEHRYNALPEIARRLGLSMNNRSLWKDRAALELNHAVIYSFDKAKVTLVDHHSASDSFVAHYEKEIRTRGHCPADWVWLVPPFSSSTTRIFHQEMYSYLCKPALLSLFEKPWETYERWIGRILAPKRIETSKPEESDDTKDKFVVAYGTETGSAQRNAEQLQKYLVQRLCKDVDIFSLDDIRVESIKGTLCIVTSSFGEGEPPANAKDFNEALNSRSAQDLSFRYAVYGLGSSSYADTYQEFPKFVDSKLLQLGARRIVPLGESDDCEPEIAEKTFESWMKTLAIAIEVGTESSAVVVDDTESFSRKLQSVKGHTQLQLTGNRAFFNPGSPVSTRDEDPRSTYHVELSTLDRSSLLYSEGDHISVLPISSSQTLETVEPFLSTWGKEIIEGCSVSEIIRSYVDLEAIVDSVQVSNMISRTTLKDRDALTAFIYALPLKTARHFSISSSAKYHPHTLHIAIARRPGGKVSEPLTAPVDAANPARFDVLIRHSKFSLPEDLSIPIILVGTGTGVGPLRGMMHGRLAAQKEAGVQGGTITNVLGFRSPEEHCYLDEFEDAVSESHSKVAHYPAYSRTSSKERIGDVIKRISKDVIRLLDQEGAYVFVCGQHGIRTSVEESVAVALYKELGLSDDAVKAYIGSLKKKGRLSFSTYARSVHA